MPHISPTSAHTGLPFSPEAKESSPQRRTGDGPSQSCSRKAVTPRARGESSREGPSGLARSGSLMPTATPSQQVSSEAGKALCHLSPCHGSAALGRLSAHAHSVCPSWLRGAHPMSLVLHTPRLTPGSGSHLPAWSWSLFPSSPPLLNCQGILCRGLYLRKK